MRVPFIVWDQMPQNSAESWIATVRRAYINRSRTHQMPPVSYHFPDDVIEVDDRLRSWSGNVFLSSRVDLAARFSDHARHLEGGWKPLLTDPELEKDL